MSVIFGAQVLVNASKSIRRKFLKDAENIFELFIGRFGFYLIFYDYAN